jgi:serine/threonine protein kinase
MSAQGPTELLAFLLEHGFLTPFQVQQVGGIDATKCADAKALAGELVERKWLTAYQANQLLLGRGRNLLVGSYRLIDRLGEGAMAQVFKAYHASMDRMVALKIIPRERLSNPVAVERFSREVKAIARLAHPNVVIAFEFSQAGEAHFLAMELVEGIDLAKLVQQSGPLPIARACEYIRQASLGMQHAHEKGLVHRDIKPGNLMVTRAGPDAPAVIKILDFGLTRFESETPQGTRLTQLGRIVGTVDYIAPEQAHNAQTADIRADVYSLGCTLFYLLTGKPPFLGTDAVARIGARVIGSAPSVRSLRPEVPSALDKVLARMMARQPAARYQTPGEVAEALQPFAAAAGQNPTRANPSMVPPPPPPAPRKSAESVQTARSIPSLPQPLLEREDPSFAFEATAARKKPKKKRRRTGKGMYGWLVGCVAALLSGLLVVGWFMLKTTSAPVTPRTFAHLRPLATVALPAGRSVDVDVVVDRSGPDQALRVQFVGLPAGVDGTDVVVPPGSGQARVQALLRQPNGRNPVRTGDRGAVAGRGESGRAVLRHDDERGARETRPNHRESYRHETGADPGGQVHHGLAQARARRSPEDPVGGRQEVLVTVPSLGRATARGGDHQSVLPWRA